MTDLDLSIEYEPGSPEFIAAVRRNVPQHVLDANDAHNADFQNIVDEHAQYRNLIEMSDEAEHVKHSLVNDHRRNSKRAIQELRTVRGEAIRDGLS